MSEKGSGCGCIGCLLQLAVFVFIGWVFYSCGKNVWFFTNTEKMNKVAESATQQFHTLLSNGKCQAIGADLIGETLSQKNQDVVKTCEAIREKYGTVESAQLSHTTVRSDDSGQYVDFQYDIKFSKLQAQEKFTWRVKNDKATLENYKLEDPKQPSISPSPTLSSPSPSPTLSSPSPSPTLSSPSPDPSL